MEPLSLILGFTRFTKLYSEIVSNKFVNILGHSYKQRSILMQIHHFPVFVQSRNHSENVVIPSKFLFYVVALKATKHGIMCVCRDNLHSKCHLLLWFFCQPFESGQQLIESSIYFLIAQPLYIPLFFLYVHVQETTQSNRTKTKLNSTKYFQGFEKSKSAAQLLYRVQTLTCQNNF